MHIVIWQFIAFRIVIIIQVVVLDAKISALMSFPVYKSTGIWFVLYLLSGVLGSVLIGEVMDRFVLFPTKQHIFPLTGQVL